jgi:hypothetical protein
VRVLATQPFSFGRRPALEFSGPTNVKAVEKRSTICCDSLLKEPCAALGFELRDVARYHSRVKTEFKATHNWVLSGEAATQQEMYLP